VKSGQRSRSVNKRIGWWEFKLGYNDNLLELVNIASASGFFQKALIRRIIFIPEEKM